MTPEIEELERDLESRTATRFTAEDPLLTGLLFNFAAGYAGDVTMRPMIQVINSTESTGGRTSITGCPVCGDVQYPGRRCPVHDVD